jgi:hypothetical protein
MEIRHFIEDLVPRLTLNATVIEIGQDEREYSIAIAGTTSVITRCHVPRHIVEDATHEDDARRRLEMFLKQGADETVAAVPDGRA